MKPDTFARVKARGFRVVSQLNLPPGRYQVRVATANKTGKASSVLYDLEIPDFTAAPLTMSGVAMTAASAGEVPTVKPKDPLADFLPGPPTTAREFASCDLLVLFAEFYENQRNSPNHMLDFKAELRAEGGRVVGIADNVVRSCRGALEVWLAPPLARGHRSWSLCDSGGHAGRPWRDHRDIQIRVRENEISSRRCDGGYSFAGYGVKKLIPLLARYNIPAPVAGGLPVAALLAIFFYTRNTQLLTFDTTLQVPLQNTFFASVGFGASVLLLKRGGPLVLAMMLVASIVAALQNLLGGISAALLGQHPLMGVLAGSVTLTGGPRRLAFAPISACRVTVAPRGVSRRWGLSPSDSRWSAGTFLIDRHSHACGRRRGARGQLSRHRSRTRAGACGEMLKRMVLNLVLWSALAPALVSSWIVAWFTRPLNRAIDVALVRLDDVTGFSASRNGRSTTLGSVALAFFSSGVETLRPS